MRKIGVGLALAPMMILTLANPAAAASSHIYTRHHWRFAGYATGYYKRTVDGVSTHFTVPTTHAANGADSALAVWVGLGGNFTGGQSITNGPYKFVQIGVSLNPGGNHPITGAWYELFRDFTRPGDTHHKWGIPFIADPGDTLWLTLQWNHRHRALYMQWTNLATGQNVVKIVRDRSLYDGLRGNHDPGAEVILEGQPDRPVVKFDGDITCFYAHELASTGRGLNRFGVPRSDAVGGLAPRHRPTTAGISRYWESIRYVLYRDGHTVVTVGARSRRHHGYFRARWPLR
jgi:hypothetical protein